MLGNDVSKMLKELNSPITGYQQRFGVLQFRYDLYEHKIVLKICLRLLDGSFYNANTVGEDGSGHRTKRL